MKIEEIQDKMVDLTRAIRQLEESMPLCAAFGGENVTTQHRYKSAVLQVAYNNLREARMFMGDVLRCIGVENPYTHAYTGILAGQAPKYMAGFKVIPISWEDAIANGMGENKTHESVCLGFTKTLLGDARSRKGYLYKLLILRQKMLHPRNQIADIRSEQWHELQIYLDMAFAALKKANCYLGLRFGEIVEATQPVEEEKSPAKEEVVVEQPVVDAVVVEENKAIDEVEPNTEDVSGEAPKVD